MHIQPTQGRPLAGSTPNRPAPGKRFLRIPLVEYAALGLIVATAFVVRYIGLKFGYPLLVHADEGAILSLVVQMTRDRTLDPGNFMRPDQILYLLNFIFLNGISFIKTGKDLSASFAADPFYYYYCARILTAVLGAFIPLAAYKIGKESKVQFALPAALLFAFFPVYVLHSHYVTPDIPITLFTLLVILFALRAVRHGQPKHLYLATLFAAINTAEKYPGLLSFGIVLIAILWIQVRRYEHRPGAIIQHTLLEGAKFFGLYFLCLYLVAPNIFINYGLALDQIKNEARSTHLGADGLGWWGNMLFYLKNFVSYTNAAVILLAVVGMVGMFKARQYELLFSFYGLAYWVLLSKMALHWERWALPMYTFPLLMAAFGMGYLWQVGQTRRWLRIVLGTIFGLAIGWSLLFSLSLSIRMTYTNTNAAALQYAQANGITPENSVFEGYTPFLPGTRKFFDPAEINGQTRYLLLSSTMYGRFYNEPARYAQEIAQYEAAKKDGTLIQEFSRTDPASSTRIVAWLDDLRYYIGVYLRKTIPTRMVGPTIQIYQLAP